MIHTLYVSPGLTCDELRRQARKLLMTGGAVLRLTEGLSQKDQRELVNEFESAAAERGGLALEVLCQLAAYPQLDASVGETLQALQLPQLARALQRRASAELPAGP